MIQIHKINTQYAFPVSFKSNNKENKASVVRDSRDSIYNNSLLSQKVGLYFKGIILKPSKEEVGKALNDASTRKRDNVVISKQLVDANTEKFIFTNVHYMESDIRGMRSNSEAVVLMTINNKEKAVEVANDLDEYLAPIAMHSAISESLANGFGGKVIWKINDPEMLEKAFSMGFRSLDEDLNTALENKNEEALRSYSYQAMFGADPFEMILQDDKAFKLDENIINNLRASLEDMSSVNKLLRGEFVSVDLDDSFILGEKDKTEFSISSNGKGYIKNLSRSSSDTKINGQLIGLDEKVVLTKYDIIRSENELYMFNGKGLRLISKDASLVEELFPEGLKNLKLNQGGIGDCYFLSALASLSRHPEGQELIARMIERKPDGKYNITFPGFPEEVIEVDLDDNVYRSIGVKSVNTGVKILEQAFGQLKRTLNYSEELLPKEAKIKDWLEAGIGSDALYVLTGGKKVWINSEGNVSTKFYSDELKSFKDQYEIQNSSPDEIYNYLQKFSKRPDEYVITATTAFLDHDNLPVGLKRMLIGNHEYVVSMIDVDKKEIGIINPHDTSKEHIITYDCFLRYFVYIGGVELPFQA